MQERYQVFDASGLPIGGIVSRREAIREAAIVGGSARVYLPPTPEQEKEYEALARSLNRAYRSLLRGLR